MSDSLAHVDDPSPSILRGPLDHLLIAANTDQNESVRHGKAIDLRGYADRFTSQFLCPMKPKVIDAASSAQKQLHGFPRCRPEQRCGVNRFLQEQHENSASRSHEQSLPKRSEYDENQQQ